MDGRIEGTRGVGIREIRVAGAEKSGIDMVTGMETGIIDPPRTRTLALIHMMIEEMEDGHDTNPPKTFIYRIIGQSRGRGRSLRVGNGITNRHPVWMWM